MEAVNFQPPGYAMLQVGGLNLPRGDDQIAQPGADESGTCEQGEISVEVFGKVDSQRQGDESARRRSRRRCCKEMVKSPRVRSKTPRMASVLRRNPPVTASGKSTVTNIP